MELININRFNFILYLFSLENPYQVGFICGLYVNNFDAFFLNLLDCKILKDKFKIEFIH